MNHLAASSLIIPKYFIFLLNKVNTWKIWVSVSFQKQKLVKMVNMLPKHHSFDILRNEK